MDTWAAQNVADSRPIDSVHGFVGDEGPRDSSTPKTEA